MATKTHIQAPLPYAFDALEPYIDAKTMDVHFNGHHKAYTENLNKALQDPAAAPFADMEIEELLYNLSRAPAPIQTALRNNGGGYFNHTLFWNLMTPKSQKAAVGESAKAIDATFGSFAKFQEEFTKAAMGRFGSGWAWLIIAPDAKLQIISTANQDSPLMEGIVTTQGLPVLCLDVWEHAYYLKYQNKRAEYVKNWWNVVNWPQVESYYKMALQAAKG